MEVYPAWEPELAKPAILFSYVAALSPEYYFSQDAALMFMSKGAFSPDDCRKYGVRTKDFYLREFQNIFKSFYGGGKGSDEGGEKGLDADAERPPNF